MDDHDLYTRIARLEQRADGIDSQLRALGTVTANLAEFGADMRHLADDQREVKAEVTAIKTALDDRDKQVSGERRQIRIALIAVAGTLGSGVIAAIAAVVTAGAGG